MIRACLKAGAARVLSATGADRIVGNLFGARPSPLVIGYHRVVEDYAASSETSIPSMLTSSAMLERHLDWIGRRYRFVNLDELGMMLESGRPMDEPVAAITFDDGYSDFHDHALPVLMRKGVPAALFVVTDLVGTTAAQLHDKLYLLLAKRSGRRAIRASFPLPDITGMAAYPAMRALLEGASFDTLQRVVQLLESEVSVPPECFNRPVTWEELGRIRRSGVIVGSHTKTHIVMTNESCDRVIDEVVESRMEMERRLGSVVRHFAYPGGNYDSNAVGAVAAAGYRFAYTSCTHRSAEHPLLTIPRMIWWEESGLDFSGNLSESILSCQVNGTFAGLHRCQPHEAAVRWDGVEKRRREPRHRTVSATEGNAVL